MFDECIDLENEIEKNKNKVMWSKIVGDFSFYIFKCKSCKIPRAETVAVLTIIAYLETL